MRAMVFTYFLLIPLLVASGLPALSAEKDGRKTEMKKILPLKVGGYESDKKDEFYDRNRAFRYMDGAAELYRSYSFKLLMVRRYLKAGHPPIIIELFDMGSSEDAFGIFSYETGGEEMEVGQGADYGGGLLRFWKGKYFANVYAEKETPSTKKDTLQIGQTIARNIKQEGQKPKLIYLLPKENLLERNICYFHLHQGLNYHHFVSHDNILHLGERTNAVLASYFYAGVKGRTFLLLIQYPAEKLAEKAFQSFMKAYMPESSSGVIRTESGKWTASQSHQKYVIAVFDAPSREKAEEMIGTTVKRLEVK
ncbi:MAG: hypothetical protein QME90_06980 [Thermodesulfobacteriota bacterium]|nr:hypothetical protein [Thermodesulfobacteriota bacterium]